MENELSGLEWFIALFRQGGDVFLSLVTGIIPLLVVLMTFFNTIVALIGPERINKIGEWSGRKGILFYPLRYVVLPFLAVLFLTNPMAYTMGRFLPEKFKPAFYDSAVSFVHPPLGIFPHVNPGEILYGQGLPRGLRCWAYRSHLSPDDIFLLGLS